MIGVLDPRIVNESQVKDKTVAIGRAMDVMSARSLVSQARSLRQSMPRAAQAERKQPLDMSIGHPSGMHMAIERCHSFKASTREMVVLVLCTIMPCVEKLNNGSKSPLSVELYQDLGMGSAREAEVPRYVSRQIQGLCSLGPQAGRNSKIRSLSVHVYSPLLSSRHVPSLSSLSREMVRQNHLYQAYTHVLLLDLQVRR
jgi:hypothetical protein